LRELAVPLWNPYQAAGVPFLATLQPGALYPARLLLLVTDVTRAMAWSTIGHLVVLVVATYVLCRGHGARRSGAVVGAGVFAVACGRPMLFSPSFLESSTWLPIMVLAAHRLIVTGSWRWVAALGVAAAMPVLAGGYQVAVYAAYGLAIFVLALLCDPRRRGNRPVSAVFGQLALAGVLAVGLMSPQMLTTLAWSSESVRQTSHLAEAQIQLWAFEAWPSILMGKIVQLTFPGAILAVIGFATAGRFGLMLAAFSLAGLFLSLGPGAPGFWVYRHLPAFGMFRGPGRIFTTQVAFFAAFGAALGFTALMRLGPLERWRLRPTVEALGLGLVLLVLVPRMKNDAVLPWTSSNQLFLEGMPGMFARLKETDGRVAMFGRRGDWALTPRHGMSHRFPVLTDYEPLSSRHLRDYLRVLTGLPVEDALSLPFTGSVFPEQRLPHPALFDLAAVHTLVLPKDSPAKEHAPPLVRTDDFVLYEMFRNPSALPRAYLTDHVRVVPDAAAALATIVDETFDGHREAVVVGAPDEADTIALRSAPPAPVRAAQRTVDAPEQAIEFTTDRPAAGPRGRLCARLGGPRRRRLSPDPPRESPRARRRRAAWGAPRRLHVSGAGLRRRRDGRDAGHRDRGRVRSRGPVAARRRPRVASVSLGCLREKKRSRRSRPRSRRTRIRRPRSRPRSIGVRADVRQHRTHRLEHRDELRAVTRRHGPDAHLLRTDALGDRRRAYDVGEENCDELPLALERGAARTNPRCEMQACDDGRGRAGAPTARRNGRRRSRPPELRAARRAPARDRTPQRQQNRASSRFSFPQLAQRTGLSTLRRRRSQPATPNRRRTFVEPSRSRGESFSPSSEWPRAKLVSQRTTCWRGAACRFRVVARARRRAGPRRRLPVDPPRRRRLEAVHRAAHPRRADRPDHRGGRLPVARPPRPRRYPRLRRGSARGQHRHVRRVHRHRPRGDPARLPPRRCVRGPLGRAGRLRGGRSRMDAAARLRKRIRARRARGRRGQAAPREGVRRRRARREVDRRLTDRVRRAS
jgi:hypothetical protein